MSNENSQIIDLQQIKAEIKLVEQDGKNIVMHEAADKAVAMLKMYEKAIKEAIDLFKEQVPEALLPFNAKTMRGKYCTISVSAPRKTSSFVVDEEADKQFYIETKSKKANVEAIEQYLELNDGRLPVGIHRNTPKPVVSIRAKAIESKEDNK